MRSSSWPDSSAQWPQEPRPLEVERQPPEDTAEPVKEDIVEEEEGLQPGVNGGADPRYAGGATLLELAVQGRQVGADDRAGEVLGHEVGGGGSPNDLEEGDCPARSLSCTHS